MPKNSKVIVIVGPTGSGKTSLAIDLANKYNGEIICADSRTVYRYMDIGTAKPSRAEQRYIKHHLLDVIDPNERYSVVEFKTECQKAIKSIQKRGKVPFIVGGSGLYIDAVLFDYTFRPGKDTYDTSGMTQEEIMQKAKDIYPQELANIDINNIRRVERLLQLGPANDSDRRAIKIDCKIIGVGTNRLIQKQKIASRTNQMLNKGIVQETEKIISKFGLNCPGLNTIGYKQCVTYIGNNMPEIELADAINRATLDLAKRQMTWFKRNKEIFWLEPGDDLEKFIANYLA